MSSLSTCPEPSCSYLDTANTRATAACAQDAVGPLRRLARVPSSHGSRRSTAARLPQLSTELRLSDDRLGLTPASPARHRLRDSKPPTILTDDPHADDTDRAVYAPRDRPRPMVTTRAVQVFLAEGLEVPCCSKSTTTGAKASTRREPASPALRRELHECSSRKGSVLTVPRTASFS